MTGTKRILADQCCGAIIDYQDYFLAQLEPRSRARQSCLGLLDLGFDVFAVEELLFHPPTAPTRPWSG